MTDRFKLARFENRRDQAQTNHMTTSSIYTRKVRGTGETLTIGLCAELDIDNDGEPKYKYATFCEDHRVFVLSKTRQLAYDTRGIDFCDDCRAAQAQATPSREDEISKARTVDTEVARLWGEFHKVNSQISPLRKQVTEAKTGRFYSDEQRAECVAKLQVKIEALQAQAAPLMAAAVDYDKANYEGWNRFFLVQHIHSNMHCSSFRPTTQIGWLPDVSGLTEAEAVAAHGETLCTICFPSAPTELTTKAVPADQCPGSGQALDSYKLTGRENSYYSPQGTCRECGQVVGLTSRNSGKVRKHSVSK